MEELTDMRPVRINVVKGLKNLELLLSTLFTGQQFELDETIL